MNIGVNDGLDENLFNKWSALQKKPPAFAAGVTKESITKMRVGDGTERADLKAAIEKQEKDENVAAADADAVSKRGLAACEPVFHDAPTTIVTILREQ